jgi:hypothetical protein
MPPSTVTVGRRVSGSIETTRFMALSDNSVPPGESGRSVNEWRFPITRTFAAAATRRLTLSSVSGS